ncbi:MAG: Rpn family recombination-promoting nuclease/putative transposase, partial [Candidatus Ornithomonoglobus sp.]
MLNRCGSTAIFDSEVAPDEIDQKFTRLDLNMTTNKGLINVEIQISNNGDFPERGLYYWAQRYGRQLKKGDSYSDIRPTISIYIVDFKMFDTDSFYSFYTMAD